MLIEPGTTYLNTASFGPLPVEVHLRVEALRRAMNSNPEDFQLRALPDLLWRAREDLATFLGGKPQRLLLTANTTVGMNFLASRLALEPPGEILLTDQEYPTMRWCWERAARRVGLDVRTVTLPPMPTGPDEVADVVCSAMRPQTKLLFFSHVLHSTGAILPARKICAEARARSIMTVVDGAQAAGFLRVELDRLNCDAYAGSCHKWLLAPMGAGFLYFGRASLLRLEPLHVSWGYETPVGELDLDGRNAFGSTQTLRRLECEGTRDLCSWLAIPAALEIHRRFGADMPAAGTRALAVEAREALQSLGLRIATPADTELSGPIVSFHWPTSTTAAGLRQRFWDRFRIAVAVVDGAESPLVRLSLHFFNDVSDIHHFIESVNILLSD